MVWLRRHGQHFDAFTQLPARVPSRVSGAGKVQPGGDVGRVSRRHGFFTDLHAEFDDAPYESLTLVLSRPRRQHSDATAPQPALTSSGANEAGWHRCAACLPAHKRVASLAALMRQFRHL